MPASALNYMREVTAFTRKKAEEILTAVENAGFVINTIYGFNPQSPPEHSSGKALDFMCSKEAGDWIADYAWEHRKRLGVKWIIWWQRIRSTSPGKSGNWENMADRGSITQNHKDHVHIFFDDVYTPLPSQEKPATPSVPSGGVPSVISEVNTFYHPGNGWCLTPNTLFLPKSTPRIILTNAGVEEETEFPIIEVRLRWVSWSGKQWDRYSGNTNILHLTNPEANLRLDVYSTVAGNITTQQQALVWE